MIRKRVGKAVVRGEPTVRLVIVAEGPVDVFRVGRALEAVITASRPSVALHQLGVRILHSLDHYQPGIVRELSAKGIGPTRVTYRGRRRRPVQLRLGMPADEVLLLEDTVR